jgi:hypothetical protein
VRAALWIVVAGLAAGGCGGEERTTAAEEPTKTPTPTPTPTETANPAPVERARSVDDCLKLWNADALAPENYQVSANEFVAELARKGRTPVLVDYQRPDCFVVVPIGPRRIAWFTAGNGRSPYSVPQRRNLEAGERVPYNARAMRDGRIRPARR